MISKYMAIRIAEEFITSEYADCRDRIFDTAILYKNTYAVQYLHKRGLSVSEVDKINIQINSETSEITNVIIKWSVLDDAPATPKIIYSDRIYGKTVNIVEYRKILKETYLFDIQNPKEYYWIGKTTDSDTEYLIDPDTNMVIGIRGGFNI